MENINMLWFYLEPYVFVNEDAEAILFYNAKTGKGMLFDKNETINKMIVYLKSPKNMYSIRIGVKEPENESLYNLIQSLQEASFGDLIEGHLPKPIIMPPILSLIRSVEHLESDMSLLRENIMSYLHEATIYVNGDSWRYTRYDVKPCNQCRFKLICPSPSGYESVIDKPNLCHIKS